MKKIYLLLFASILIVGCQFNNKKSEDATDMEMTEDTITTEAPSVIEDKEAADESYALSYDTDDVKITPISHATFVLETDNTVIYVDPVGGAKAFDNFPKPQIILVTDIHGDHLNAETLEGLYKPNVQLVVPKEVKKQLPESIKEKTDVLSNGQSISLKTSKMNVDIEAIPMYNIRPEALQYHEPGRGNGYILTVGGKRIYISGDTEDIPEMRNLKNIDLALVCMNLPYTMTVESAADAVLEFKPKKVFPYHYRGTDGLSDVKMFKKLVSAGNKDIQVVQLEWYPSY